MMVNDVDFRNNSLPYKNLPSTATIIANCQSIRGDDLLTELMPQKINTTITNKGESICAYGGSGGNNYRDYGNGTGGNNYRDHGGNRDRNKSNNTNSRNGDR